MAQVPETEYWRGGFYRKCLKNINKPLGLPYGVQRLLIIINVPLQRQFSKYLQLSYASARSHLFLEQESISHHFSPVCYSLFILRIQELVKMLYQSIENFLFASLNFTLFLNSLELYLKSM